MHLSAKSILSLLFFCSITLAQSLSVGVKAGVPATDAFDNKTFSSASSAFHTFSNSKNYIIGPMVELHLPFGFSVEADALYRPLNLTTQSGATSNSLGAASSSDHSSWEFPILAKYRFLHTPFIKPYVEAGPSFRTLDSLLSRSLSNAGVTLGAGIELKLLKLRIGPELRYTHWSGDSSDIQRVFSSNQNQGEFLVGFSF